MKSIGRRLLSSVCALALVANSVAGMMAQDRKSEIKAAAVQIGAELAAAINVTASDPTGAIRIPEVFSSGLAKAAQQGGDSAFRFFSQEMSFDNRMVKGAPFSADIVSETIQTLPDGNRIVQRSEGRIYRDSQGRTRNERTFQMGGSSEQRQVINIIDPVTNASYSLDPETRIARKTNHFFAMTGGAPTSVFTPPFNPDAPSHQPRGVPGGVPGGPAGMETTPATPDKPIQPTRIPTSSGVSPGAATRKVWPVYPAIAKEIGASGDVQVQILISETGAVIEASAISGHPVLRKAAEDAARRWVFKPTELEGKPVKQPGILMFKFVKPKNEEPAPALVERSDPKYTTNTEQLGKQMVEGVECEGTRAVTTMPSGAIGNERPIETVNETWYSTELQMMILSKRSDPRFGESTYRVTNINRSEPDAALFQVPSEYTIIDSRSKKVEVDVKEFEEMRRKLREQGEGTRKPNNQ